MDQLCSRLDDTFSSSKLVSTLLNVIAPIKWYSLPNEFEQKYLVKIDTFSSENVFHLDVIDDIRMDACHDDVVITQYSPIFAGIFREPFNFVDFL